MWLIHELHHGQQDGTEGSISVNVEALGLYLVEQSVQMVRDFRETLEIVEHEKAQLN